MEKKRVDQLLVDRGLVESKTKAQALIMAGLVHSDNKKMDKAGVKISVETPLTVKGKEHPWVSRGGLKLVKGLDVLNIDISGFQCIDVGASTGGFSDVLLSKNIDKVYAVDVGYGQLAHKIRNNDKVVVLERTNARNLDKDLVPDPIDLVVCDASFIGLEKVLPAAMNLIEKHGYLVALIKPQFEVGKGRVGKGGVVREPELHREVCDKIENWLSSLEGWNVLNIVESPIKGPEGNIEFLIIGEYKG